MCIRDSNWAILCISAAETSAYFEELDKSYYKDGIKKLENHLTKYIILKGDYVEKLKRFFPQNSVFFIFALTYQTSLV